MASSPHVTVETSSPKPAKKNRKKSARTRRCRKETLFANSINHLPRTSPSSRGPWSQFGGSGVTDPPNKTKRIDHQASTAWRRGHFQSLKHLVLQCLDGPEARACAFQILPTYGYRVLQRFTKKTFRSFPFSSLRID